MIYTTIITQNIPLYWYGQKLSLATGYILPIIFIPILGVVNQQGKGCSIVFCLHCAYDCASQPDQTVLIRSLQNTMNSLAVQEKYKYISICWPLQIR